MKKTCDVNFMAQWPGRLQWLPEVAQGWDSYVACAGCSLNISIANHVQQGDNLSTLDEEPLDGKTDKKMNNTILAYN